MMADFEKLQAFASAFDGHVFRGKDGELLFPPICTNTDEVLVGSEYQAVVEYAPSQKIPSQKSKPRVDARQGQIDKGMSALDLRYSPLMHLQTQTTYHSSRVWQRLFRNRK